MRKVSLSLAVLAVCAVLSGCQPSEEAKEAREAGITALNSGNYAEAIESFDKAIDQSGSKVGKFQLDVLKYRSEAEYSLGDYGAAVHTCDVLIQVDEEQAEYYNMRSIANAAAGNLKEAVADYSAAAKMDQTASLSREALFAAGQALEDAGEYQQAMDLYQQAVSGETRKASVYNRMGLCRMKEEKYEEAVSCFEEGMAAGTDEDIKSVAECEFNRAVAYEFQGEFAKALSMMEQYVKKYGSTPEAEKEITFLKTR